MKLHLVTGFLGSGKTTAIINACKLLAGRGMRVGVITNDQGKFLVDTAFFKLKEIPAVEVSGGCFCCNYTDLNAQLKSLIEQVHPDIIFAESVGSCADVVATVVKPMLLQLNGSLQPFSFSLFADARMLRARLNGIPLPFSDEIVYIFDKQIEETNLLICNKMDCLSLGDLESQLALARQRWPRKIILPQVSLTEEGVEGWVDLIDSGALPVPKQSLEMDYQYYGEGEQKLAWLNEEIEIETASGDLRPAVTSLLQNIRDRLQETTAAIAHIKFILQDDCGEDVKISHSTYGLEEWSEQIPDFRGKRLRVLANARVELPAAELKEIFCQSVEALGRRKKCTVRLIQLEAFHPGKPDPEMRI